MYIYTQLTCWELDTIPDYSEYLKAVKSANKLTSGTGRISTELLKSRSTATEKLNPAVYQILVKIWETSEIPDYYTLCSVQCPKHEIVVSAKTQRNQYDSTCQKCSYSLDQDQSH